MKSTIGNSEYKEIDKSQLLDSFYKLEKHYLEIIEKYYTHVGYDGNSQPDYLFNNWIDVEGIDYGGMFIQFEESNLNVRDSLFKFIKEKLETIESEFLKVYISDCENENKSMIYIVECNLIKDYGDEYGNKETEYLERKDTIITFSDSPIEVI